MKVTITLKIGSTCIETDTSMEPKPWLLGRFPALKRAVDGFAKEVVA